MAMPIAHTPSQCSSLSKATPFLRIFSISSCKEDASDKVYGVSFVKLALASMAATSLSVEAQMANYFSLMLALDRCP